MVNVRPVGKEHMLQKVHRSALLVMQASSPEKTLLHACHVLQAMQGYIQGHRAIVARLAHGVLKVRAGVQCVKQAHSALPLEHNHSNAAPAPIRRRGSIHVKSVPGVDIAPLAQLLVLHARKAKLPLTALPLANHVVVPEVGLGLGLGLRRSR